MKILMQFLNQEYKSEIITTFMSMDNCIVNEEELIVPKMIKINFQNNKIKCYCMNINVVERILSNVCTIENSSDNNIGNIKFPKGLSLILETKIYSFEKLMQLCSNGTIQYINTFKESLKCIVPLSQWLTADLNVNEGNAYIKLNFNNYKLSVSDGSAYKFCIRVKEHPLISASSLYDYFDFGSEIKIKPELEYILLWKTLKSEHGYKKYSNFINECNDKMNITYDEGKKYRCEFEKGKIDFQLLSIGDKYPKKVIVQIEELKNMDILESLNKNLNLNTIDLVAKVNNLSLSMGELFKLKFYKDEDFFIFTNINDNFKAIYDIGNNTMSLKQEIKCKDLNLDSFNHYLNNMKKWIDDVIK